MNGSRTPISFLALCVLLGCGLDSHVVGDDSRQAGGSGSEAGNALKIVARTPNGGSIDGARVEIWRADSVSAIPSYRGVTGVDGRAEIRVADGDWSVVVRQGGFAFRREIRNGGLVEDTLRPVARLAGILDGGLGQIVSVPGVGASAECDSRGFFQLDSLPSGKLPFVVASKNRWVRSVVDIEPGVDAMVLAEAAAVPDSLPSLPADSLIAWAPRSPPALLPQGALGNFDAFAVALRFERTDSLSQVIALSWTNGSSRGVKVGWRGLDTLLLTVDEKTVVIAGVPLGAGPQQLGLSWNGMTLEIYLGAKLLLSFAYSSPEQRDDWNAPVFGGQGVRQIDWIAFQRGELTEEWLENLSGR